MPAAEPIGWCILPGSMVSGKEPINPLVVVRRGFVDEVRLSTVDWLTHGPALVRQQPLTRVVLSDRKPAEDPSFESAARFMWFKRRDLWGPGTEQWPWDVPPEFWPFMPDCGPGSGGLPTLERANEVISRAALAYARGPHDGLEALPGITFARKELVR